MGKNRTMEHISNEEKAKEIMNKFYGNLMPHYTHNEVFDRCFRARYADILEAMQWKDEQSTQEKQQMIERTIDWVQKEATKHIGFNAISEECSLSWDFTDLLVKAMKGE